MHSFRDCILHFFCSWHFQKHALLSMPHPTVLPLRSVSVDSISRFNSIILNSGMHYNVGQNFVVFSHLIWMDEPLLLLQALNMSRGGTTTLKPVYNPLFPKDCMRRCDFERASFQNGISSLMVKRSGFSRLANSRWFLNTLSLYKSSSNSVFCGILSWTFSCIF